MACMKAWRMPAPAPWPKANSARGAAGFSTIADTRPALSDATNVSSVATKVASEACGVVLAQVALLAQDQPHGDRRDVEVQRHLVPLDAHDLALDDGLRPATEREHPPDDVPHLQWLRQLPDVAQPVLRAVDHG